MEQLNPSSLQLRSLAILTGLASLPITCHQFALEIAAKGALLARGHIPWYQKPRLQFTGAVYRNRGLHGCPSWTSSCRLARYLWQAKH